MMLTEDQAKTKACFRAATFGGSQQLAEGPGPNCIGSSCMAWRFAPPPAPPFASEGVDQETVRLLAAGMKINAIRHDRNTTGRTLKDSKDYCEALALSLGIESYSWNRPGYCGLAGPVTP